MRLMVTILIAICVTACGRSKAPPPPEILSFDTAAETITEGDAVDLTAVFTLGTASIDNGVGAAETGVAIAVSPITTTTYTLTVTNAAGTAVTIATEVIVRPILTGFFTDSAVEGLNYQTATQSGVTSALGAFNYVEGESISFTIGTFFLGDTVDAKAEMTALDLIPGAVVITTASELRSMLSQIKGSNPNAAAIAFATLHNMVTFLQAIDSDKDASNGITIADGMGAILAGVSLDFTAGMPQFRRDPALKGVMAEAVAQDLVDSGFVKREGQALDHFYLAQGFTHSLMLRATVDTDSDGNGTPNYIYTYTYDDSGNELTYSRDSDGDGDGDGTDNSLTTYTNVAGTFMGYLRFLNPPLG